MSERIQWPVMERYDDGGRVYSCWFWGFPGSSTVLSRGNEVAYGCYVVDKFALFG